MNRNQEMPMAVIVVVIATLAVSAVTANPQTLNTPLYTFRMEQASSEMNFLPEEKSTFIYTTEKGYQLNAYVHGYPNNVKSLPVTYHTCLCTVGYGCSYTLVHDCGCTYGGCWYTSGEECGYTLGIGCWTTHWAWGLNTLEYDACYPSTQCPL